MVDKEGALVPFPHRRAKQNQVAHRLFLSWFFLENAKIGNALRQYLRGMKYDVIVLETDPADM